MCTLRKTSRESENDDFFLEKHAHSRPAATARAKANIQMKLEPLRSPPSRWLSWAGWDCDTPGPSPGRLWAAFGAGGCGVGDGTCAPELPGGLQNWGTLPGMLLTLERAVQTLGDESRREGPKVVVEGCLEFLTPRKRPS